MTHLMLLSRFAWSTAAACAGDGNFASVGGAGEFGNEGGEEVCGGGAGGGQLRFQRVHQGHQLFHLRHNPLLLGEGGKGKWEALNLTGGNVRKWWPVYTMGSRN